MLCCSGSNAVHADDNFTQVIGTFPEDRQRTLEQTAPEILKTLKIKLAPGMVGFTPRVVDGKLTVASLARTGGLELYNLTAKVDERVFRGDTVTSVNGKTKVEDMQKELASGKECDVEVKQGGRLEVHLKRVEGVPLGLGLEQTFPEEDARFDEVHDQIYLKVKEIKQTGLVPCYNCDHPEKAVTPQHYIVEVNGERVDTTKMLNSIKNGTEWSFVFRHLNL